MEETSQRDANYPRILPRSLTAACCIKNKGALDWSSTSLLAYGSNHTVVVVDTVLLQVVQTLDKHKTAVVKVKWPGKIMSVATMSGASIQKPTYHPLLLASADTSGLVIVWDVITGVALHILNDGNRPIQDIMWAQHFDYSEKYLMAIHPPYSFVVWDVTTGTKLWKKTYAEQILAMDFDPFDSTRLAFLCPDCILFVEDFSLYKAPSTNGRKFYISSPKAATTPGTPSVSFPTSSSDRSRDRLRKLMRDIIVGESAPRPEEQGMTSLNECLQLSFHRCLRHIICLVYAREILLVDLRIHHTVAVLPSTDRSYSPLQQLILCRQRDVLICVHESGSLSGRIRKGIMQSTEAATPSHSPWNTPELDVELHYEQRSQTDSIRLTKNNKILGAALHPLLESRTVLLLSDGRLYFYDLSSNVMKQQGCLAEIMPPLWTNCDSKPSLKFCLSGLLTSLSGYAPSSNQFVMKMCPPLTVKNWQYYQPLVAIGCANGTIQVCDVSSGLIKKELAVHNYAVKGIEWIQMDEFLSYAQSSPAAIGGWVRNEILLTNVQTGRVVSIRADRGEESPIELVRVSPLKQYFMVVFKEAPPELWDLRHLTLIRTLPKRFPTITSLEWLPSHLQRHVKKSLAEDSDSSVTLLTGMSVKEFFVFADPDGNLYHLTVDGSVVKDGARLSPPNTLNGIVSMTWKSEWMALGDAEGGVAIWEWRTRHFRPLPHSKSPIRKLRFAPGKNNMKLLVLHMEGLDIWDVKESERLGQWRNSPFRDYLSILDAEWSASDRPLLACSDGSVRVFDISLNQCSSSLAEDAQERISFPLLMPRSAFQAVKSGLQLNLSASTECTNSHKDLILNYISDHIPSNEAGIPERCFRAALQCGDQPQAELWTVASYYLRFHAGKECTPLDTVYDLLCDSSTYRQMAAERAALYQSKPRAYEHTRQLTRDHLLLNDKDKAIALLLNTEPEHGHFYSNHLLACLAAILQPAGCHGNAHSTLKLVATHLIASGHIWQGVEILILNGQVPDACRYLQANHLWEDSARVAKLLLMDKEKGVGTLAEVSEAAEIWRRWASHLSNCRQKFGATLILIAVGAWHRAAELLVHQHMHDAAALLLRAAHQNGLYQASDATQLEFMHGVFCQYARLLYESGWQSEAKEWAGYGGPNGQQFIDEWKILDVDTVSSS